MKTRGKIEWRKAPDVKKRLTYLANLINDNWLKPNRIFCFRSEKAKTRAFARIWGLSRIWQNALEAKPAYIIEVISEKFDRLSDFEKDKVLIHELTHIPRNFSGSLVPHKRYGKRSFEDRVRALISFYKKRKWD